MPERFRNELIIPPPRADRPPLRVNVFEAMQHGNTQLMPLFPYLHPGAMVPAGAMIIGGPSVGYGHFFHHNTQDEVVLAMAANGAVLQTGQVFVGARIHGVNSFLKNEKDPEGLRHHGDHPAPSRQRPANRGVSLRCEKCHEEIYHKEFDATPPEDAMEGEHPFVSVALMPDCIRRIQRRRGEACLSQMRPRNEPFPVAAWGWDKYAAQSNAAIAGREALRLAMKPAAK